MNEHRGRSFILAVIAFALLGVLARQAVGAFVIAPSLESPDPDAFVASYFTARQWGYGRLAERIARPDSSSREDSPTVTRPGFDDVLFASNIELSPATRSAAEHDYEEERRLTVAYESVWRDEIGSPPGNRHYFVRIGRDSGERWVLLGMGTGP